MSADLTLALSGDCMATRGPLITDDPAAAELRELLNEADFAFTNLEVALATGRGNPVSNAAGGGCLIAEPRVLDAIADAGFSVFGGANNHSLDMGVDGPLGTVDALRHRGLPYAGIGHDLTAARRPTYVDRPGGSIALISCSSTFLPGQEAAPASPDLPGRPGLSPLRHSATVDITQEQLDVLTEIDRSSGLRARRTEARTLVGVDPALFPPDRPNLFGTRFRVAEEPGFSTACDDSDLVEITHWVEEARGRADIVLVSVHSHEPGETPETPAEFLQTFGRRMIDAGADVVVGHGPHQLRGAEVYDGKPIFYSLGNIVSQIELADLVSAEDYAKVGGLETMTPGRYFAERSGYGKRLFAPHRQYWETLVPVLEFRDGELAHVDLHPVDLGFGAPVHRRGRPRRAAPGLAADILNRFAVLCEANGTTVRIKDDRVAQLPVGPDVDGG